MLSKEEKYWGKFAENYDKDVEFMFGRDIQCHILEKLLAEGKMGNTVEFGCGTGLYSEAIAHNSIHLTATDLSSEMVKVAEARLKKAKNITVQKEDCQDTSFENNTFDTVIMTNVFMLLPEPLKSLEENYRILKPNGKMILTCITIDKLSIINILGAFARGLMKAKTAPPNIKPYTCEKLAKLVESNMFNVEENTLLQAKMNAIYLKAIKQ